MGENNGILKEKITSESFSNRVDDTEKSHKSDREENNVTKITIADQFNETRSLPEFSPAGSKREIKNPEKIGDMEVTERHRCQRPLRDIIGEREQRREELEKTEGDLRQRLDMLECSMPAVMVWNMWRMSQGTPVCRIKRILEKQFKDARELSCRSTPSCHYDCRVREVEAKRKLALKRVEEARTLWSEKLATLEERKRKLDEARRIQEEQKNAIERLNEESRALREAMEKEVGELCRCGDVQCKRRHLDKVSSVTSVESGDIRCLENLQRLAEEEVTIKREIAELERREEAYMRTLQQADNLWSKMEGDMVGVTSELQGQLDMKTAANQQLANRVCELEDALEKCLTRFTACRTELEKFLSIEKVEATIGRDDDIAKVADKEVAVRARVVHRPIGRADDVATVRDGEVLAQVEVADGEALARVEVEDREALARVALSDVDVDAAFVGDDKFVTAKPDSVDIAVDRPAEDLAYEQRRFKEVREYLAKLGSLEELYKDDGESCAPDFVCNDVVSSPTGMTDEELIALGVERPALTKERDESGRERERQFQKGLAREKHDVVVDTEKKEGKEDEIPRVEIEKKVVDDRLVTMPKDRAPEVKKIEVDGGIVIQRDTILSWIDAIDTIRATAAKHPDCREVKKDADTLAEQVGTYIGIKPKKVEKEIATIITEGKQERDEIKTEQKNTAISETKLQDELIILKDKEMEPVTKTEFASLPSSEKMPTEVKAPSVKDESKLLPNLTKEEVPTPTAVSLKDSVLSPTNLYKKDLKDDTAPLAVPEPYKQNIEKIKTEETRDEEYAKRTPAAKLINNKLTINSIDKEKTLDVPNIKKEEQEVITKKGEVLPVTEIEGSEFVEQIVGKPEEISQLHETKIADIKETIPHMEIIRNEIAEVSKVPEMEEVQRDAEETILAVDVKEVKEIMPRTISPTADVTEVKKSEPDTFPIVDIEKEPAAVEQKIKTDEPASILDIKEKSSLLDEVTEEKIEIKKLELIKEEIGAAESPQIAEMAINGETKVTELSLIEDKEKKEKIEAAKLLPDAVEKETTEAEKSLPVAITEEKIGIIEAIPTLPPIKKETGEEIEAVEEALKAEIKKEEYEKVEGITPPEEVTPSIEISEKKEKEKEVILTKVPPSEEPAVKKEVPVERKMLETVQIELKIPIAEIKSTEMEMPVAQPYLIIAKIKEKELLQIIPAKSPCECYLQPPIARPFGIPQTDVLHTEIVQTEVIQAEVVQTEVMQTKIVRNEVVQTEVAETEAQVVQITTQAVSTAEPPRTPPPIRIISEYLKPAVLKASCAEIAGDRPEITGRKMLWRKRLKDQSTVTTATTGSQTDKTSHVSYDRVVRDERERARVPTDELLRSIKIAAARLARPDMEREIRTINYGGRVAEVGSRVACNCCLCGRTPITPTTGPRLELRPQMDAKTAAPPAEAAAFKRMFVGPNIDHPMPHDRLCPDCKARIQDRMPRERYHVEKDLIKKISRDLENCGCASLTGTSCRAVPRKRVIEKRDQACLAKIPKRKTNLAEQKRRDDLQSILEEKSTVEPFSPSCTCFKLEKTAVEPIRKGNCFCAN